MSGDSAAAVIGQFVVVSLVIERIIAVASKLFSKPAADVTESSTDPWQDWTRAQVLAALILGLAICYLYKLDLLANLIGSLQGGFQIIGFVVSATVLAGGTAGIRGIASALGSVTKSIKADAAAKLVDAKLRIQLSAVQGAPLE